MSEISEIKNLHLIGQSPKSWEDAVQQALAEASEMVNNIQSIYVQEFLAVVKDNKIENYHVNTKITFLE